MLFYSTLKFFESFKVISLFSYQGSVFSTGVLCRRTFAEHLLFSATFIIYHIKKLLSTTFFFLFLQDLLSSKHNSSVILTHIVVSVNIFLSFLQAAAKYLSYFGVLNAVSLFIISSDRSNVNTLFSLLRKKIYRPKLSVNDTVRQRSGTVIS